MSASSPASRRSTPGSRRFDYCRFIELDYVPMETSYMVSMRPTKPYASTKSPIKGKTSTKSPDQHSRSTNSPPAPRFRRVPAAPSYRDPSGTGSLSSSNSGSCKGSDCSPTKGRHKKYTSCTDNHGIRPPPPEQYLTPLQQKEVCIRHLRARLKETMSTLQDRDTEIDELRGQLYRMQEDWVEEECHRVEAQLALKEARQEIQQLKHAVETVQARLSDAGELSGDIGVQKYFQDINTQNHKLENLLLSMELAQASLAKEGEAILGGHSHAGGSAPASVSGESPGVITKSTVEERGSCSCDGSPARSLTRSSTYTKLSDQALVDRSGKDFPCLSGDGTQDSGFVCCGESSIPSRADLLLEAAFLSEETASLLNSYTQTLSHSLANSLSHTFSHTLPNSSLSHNWSHSLPRTMPHSSTYENVCPSEPLKPCRCSLGGVGCMSHPCLSHQHLYLHSLREAGIQTESCPIPVPTCPSDLDTIAEQRTFHSQACSPTSTWMSDEGEEDQDSITTTTSVTTATVMSTATEPIPVTKTPPVLSLPRSATVACSMKGSLCEEQLEEEEKQEQEKRQKETTLRQKLCESTLNRQEVEGYQRQVSLVTGSKVEDQGSVEEAAPGKLCKSTETLAGMQHDHKFVGCCGESRQGGTILGCVEKVNVLAGSTQGEKKKLNTSKQGSSPELEQPHTSQPRRSTSHEASVSVTPVEICHEDDNEDKTKELGATGGTAAEKEDLSGSEMIQKSYWSRHFLIDLLAVAIPVVPTVAWLCRGPVRDTQPIYHIGSLLRGCCTVALHSLRRGGGLRHYPAGGGDLGGSQL